MTRQQPHLARGPKVKAACGGRCSAAVLRHKPRHLIYDTSCQKEAGISVILPTSSTSDLSTSDTNKEPTNFNFSMDDPENLTKTFLKSLDSYQLELTKI